ncbi:MAG TPA: hypothetical protein VIJ51_14470 [Solirubrobacteraceae bacterium]
MPVIGSVVWEPEHPVIGESVKVTVLRPDGSGFAATDYVTIDGVVASCQYLQFTSSGTNPLAITALGPDGKLEYASAVVSVLDAPISTTETGPHPAADTQVLTIASNIPGECVYGATFALQPLSVLLAQPPVVSVTDERNRLRGGTVNSGLLASTDPAARYAWCFGHPADVLYTATPVIDHDFGPAIDAATPYQAFHVSVKDRRAPGEPTYKRTVSVMNMYVAAKQRGYVVPPVRVGGWALETGGALEGTAEIANPEATDPIILRSCQLVPIHTGGTGLTSPTPLAPLGGPITVPAGGTVTIQVSAPIDLIGRDAIGFSVILTQHDAKAADAPVLGGFAALKLRATAHFLLAPEHRLERTQDCGAEGVESPRTAGLFVNARRGDVILSAGGNAFVGGLLTQVSPPQNFSHCGIVTASHDQLTHCTASQEWLEDHPIGWPVIAANQPIHGFESDAVKYGWPGAVTQTVEQAVAQQDLRAQDNGLWYRLEQDFSVLPPSPVPAGVFMLVPPLVVKPDPMRETPAVRRQLVTVADDACANTGRAHYRFYTFTEPRIGADPAWVARPDKGWAAGTFPACCSSFIWLMMKRNGALAPGADGLADYAAADRETAVDWLHGQIEREVRELAPRRARGIQRWVVGPILKWKRVPERLANQNSNAFVDDDTEPDNDSMAWSKPGDARAVSPDDLLAWSGPEQGGSLGYFEPLVYASPRDHAVPMPEWPPVDGGDDDAPAAAPTIPPATGGITVLEVGALDLRPGPRTPPGRPLVIEGTMTVKCGWNPLSKHVTDTRFLISLPAGPPGACTTGRIHAFSNTAGAELSAAADWRGDGGVIVTLSCKLDGRPAGRSHEFALDCGAHRPAGRITFSRGSRRVKLDFEIANPNQATG